LLIRLAARPGLQPDDVAAGGDNSDGRLSSAGIGMLARQLHHHSVWTAGELASDLAAARDRLELMHAENLSVAAAFELSYQDLMPG
jgi:hypothetical protein